MDAIELDHLWDEHGVRLKRKKRVWEEEGGKMYKQKGMTGRAG